MIEKTKALVVDVDGTLCSIKSSDQSYSDVAPEPQLIARLRELSAQGWKIILHSARGMNTFDGNAGEINAQVLPVLLEWLKKHQVPFDEIHMAKPWPGQQGFYIDDRSVRPREFLEHSLDELDALCRKDRIA